MSKGDPYSNSADIIINRVLTLQPYEKIAIFADNANIKIGDYLNTAAMEKTSQGSGSVEYYVVEKHSKLFGSIPIKLSPTIKQIAHRANAIIYVITGDDSVTGPVRRFWADAYAAIGKKGRCLMMPGINEDMFTRLVDINYEDLDKEGRKIIKLLDGKEIRVTTKLGTDISFSLKHKNIEYWDEGKTRAEIDSGDIRTIGKAGNIPAGEVYWEPVDYESFNGTVVVDGEFGKREKGPLPHGVKYTVSNGKINLKSITAVDLKTKKEIGLKGAAEWFKAFVKKHEDARVMYEFGVGTNPLARIKEGSSLLELEKTIGTVHFAQSSNNHNDGLVFSPIIYANGKPVMRGTVEKPWVFR